MLSFAAFTPHSPLIVPSVGRDARNRMSSTIQAMCRLEEELYSAMPETVIVISSHSIQFPNAFSVNLHDEYTASLAEFGDLSAPVCFRPDLGLIDSMQRALRRGGIPLSLNSTHALDHGTSVPLLLLASRLKDVRVIPISYSGLGPKEHFAFGRTLKEVVMCSPRRIAVIASGDLSHALSSDAPAGYRAEGAVFDELVSQSVSNVSAAKLLSASPELVEAASDCGYRPLLVLFGLLDHMNVRPEILSYEAPFGVGYMVAQFHLG
ncbi:AmmeMemoRadiSam system protein B [Candidatus Uhrbacteria bacterium RIFCSPHIGHO2_01_FULL_63_20]|uniref:AmmeMemoRadiSam system protein B n=1 Tax=Candidatus Uhrbacteria bacterium RIFCSPHIGHO2_01_FULL_63_20 TaxID=1802385 RepID=A0A1F7TKJ8_9BACT|nr:MAG: AmmeMemoRadiSam system protein B [Candidatus Uhrbacteria bacterium RIFCSPHIGHO2_01_FULL_63_20]